MNNTDYLNRLYKLYQRIPDNRPLAKMIFRECCKRYQDCVKLRADNTRVEKAYLVEKAVENNLLIAKVDKHTKKIKMPSDREIRREIANLIYSGYPIETYSGESGVSICDSSSIMQARKAENEKRAKMLLAKSKGYDRATLFIEGQLDFIDLIEFVDKE